MPLTPYPHPGARPRSSPADGYPRLRDARVGVLVADPHAVVREGLKSLVNAQPDMCVVGEAADGPAALALAAELGPDLVVLEAFLPGLDGAQVTARLREARPDRKVLVLTACEHGGTVRLLRGVGATGYVLKRAAAAELVRAIRAAAAGEAYLDPALAGGAASDPRGGPESAAVELSEREADVLRRIALGYSNKEIAARLGLSVKTVETYKARAMEKLGLYGRVDLVRFALTSGWLAGAAPDPPAPLVVSGEGVRRPS